MHDRQLAEVFMERLVHRAHERCHWCRKIFRWVDGKFERFKGPDGNYYCCEKHASAQYLSSRDTRYERLSLLPATIGKTRLLRPALLLL